MPHFVVNVFKLVGIGGVILVMNWKLALLTLVPMPLVAMGTAAVWRRIEYMFRKMWHRWSQLSVVLNDTLSGIRVVKGFAQESREMKRFDTRSYGVFRAGMRAEQTFATIIPLLSFLWGTGMLIIWYFGGRDVMGQRMTLGTLLAFQTYMMMVEWEVETDRGPKKFMTRSLHDSLKETGDGFIVTDMENNRYEIRADSHLDPRSVAILTRGI